MERLTHGDLVQKIESLRREIQDIVMRNMLVSVDVESTRRHQAENKRQCIQIFKDLEEISSRHTKFLSDVKSKAYGND